LRCAQTSEHNTGSAALPPAAPRWQSWRAALTAPRRQSWRTAAGRADEAGAPPLAAPTKLAHLSRYCVRIPRATRGECTQKT